MNSRIEKIKQTRIKRQSQDCKTFELKIDKSHLSTEKLQYLRKLFLEAKWLYNYILSTENVFEFDTKTKTVIVLNKDREQEERELKVLSSQMKQAVKQKIEYAIKSLSAKKKKQGKKKKARIGKLKFTSNYKAIVLNQYKMTYRFFDEGKKLQLQGCKHKFRINGFNQIPREAELTCATLCTRHDDFYLKVNCYLPKEERVFEEESTGIDFGLTTTLTLSNGDKMNLKYRENKRLRRSSRRLKKRVKGSKNYFRMKNQVNKEYHKLTNRKKDKKNKIVSKIVNKYKTVIVQDESIKGWHSGLYGRSVQQSLMGGIMSDLERRSHTFIKVDRFFPSTQLCPVCGKKNKHHVSIRTYTCSCGFTEDRDIKAARCIETKGLKDFKIREGLTEFTLVETDPLLNSFSSVKQVRSLKQETSIQR